MSTEKKQTTRNTFRLDANTVVTTRLTEQEFRERYNNRRQLPNFEQVDHLNRGRTSF